MRRIHIALVGVFAAGALLCGIGTGIAVGEYSGLEYRGEILLGEETLVTKTFEYDFSEEDVDAVLLSYCYWGDRRKDSLLVEDDDVPVGTVRYVVTYNEETVRPSLIHWQQEQTENGWNIVEESEEAAAAQEVISQEAASAEENGAVQEDGELAEEPGRKSRRAILELRNSWIGNEFDVIMGNKDQILADLKEKKIGFYQIAEIVEVEIRVNPASASVIDDQTR